MDNTTEPELDIQLLNFELDKVKSDVFVGSTAAFLGSLLCSMEMHWCTKTKTAATDGLNLWWNPHWFLSLSRATRRTVLVHELWHPAYLHGVRRGNRDPKIWNYACDIRINNQLETEGYSFKEIEWCWKDQDYAGWVEEDIYDDLIKKGIQPPPGPFAGDDEPDMMEPTEEQIRKIVGNLVTAVQNSKAAGKVPGGVEVHLNKFLAPVVAWEAALLQFFTDMLEDDYTWKRPNRRYPDMYLPSRFTDDGRLEHLIYYIDVSGSCTDADVLRFNSEIKYVKETFNPVKLTLVMFDTIIQKEIVFNEDDPFDKVVVVGRGGTSLVPVREHMLKHKPTAAIIFSDLQCAPMQPIDLDIPVIWVAIRAAGKTVPFGKLIHIRK